jgi:putative Ca2+/H+ antiporter (TMEM165/GDT1 family)
MYTSTTLFIIRKKKAKSGTHLHYQVQVTGTPSFPQYDKFSLSYNNTHVTNPFNYLSTINSNLTLTQQTEYCSSNIFYDFFGTELGDKTLISTLHTMYKSYTILFINEKNKI